MKSRKIPLQPFQDDMNRALNAYTAKGHVALEVVDLANQIGLLLESSGIEEAKAIYDEFCSGLAHGTGLSHYDDLGPDAFNTRESIDSRLADLENKPGDG